MSKRQKELDFSGMHRNLQQLVMAARDVGWKAKNAGPAGIRLHAPNGVAKTITVPRQRQYNADRLTSLRKQIVHYADQQSLTRVRTAVDVWQEGQETNDPAVKQIANDLIDEFSQDEWAWFIDGVPPKEDKTDADKVIEQNEDHRRIAKVEETVTEPVRRPWLARRSTHESGAYMYESQAVVEVTYPDGHVEYECSTGCGYTAAIPNRVAVHYARKRDALHPHNLPQEVIAKDPTLTEPTRHHEYSPTDRLVRLLSHVIAGLSSDERNNPDAIARAALVWAHERPDLPRDPADIKDLTSDEILDRIRLLVTNDDVPRLREQVDDLRKKLAEGHRALTALQEENAHLQEMLSVAENAAAAAEGDLAAVTEMLVSRGRTAAG